MGGVGEVPDFATEQEGLGAFRGREERAGIVYQYSIAEKARTNFWSCGSIKDKLHSVSAMEGAQNRRLDNAGSKGRWLSGLLRLGNAGVWNNHGIEL